MSDLVSWPLGRLTDAIADAVIKEDWIEAGRLSRAFKRLAAERVEYNVLVARICGEIDDCRWTDADQTLKLMYRFSHTVKHDLASYQAMVDYDRDSTILDRIVQATTED